MNRPLGEASPTGEMPDTVETKIHRDCPVCEGVTLHLVDDVGTTCLTCGGEFVARYCPNWCMKYTLHRVGGKVQFHNALVDTPMICTTCGAKYDMLD